MSEKINIELANLQNELQTLDNAVKQISKAEKISADIIKAITGLNEKYKQSFENIFKETQTFFENKNKESEKQITVVINDYKKQTEETKKVYEDLKVENVKNQQENGIEIIKLIDSHKIQLTKVDTLLESYVDLAKSTSKLSDKIDAVDFSEQFNKLAVNISELNIEIRTVKEIVVDTVKTETLSLLQKRLRRNNRKVNFTMYLMIASFAVLALMVYQYAVTVYFPEHNLLKQILSE